MKKKYRYQFKKGYEQIFYPHDDTHHYWLRNFYIYDSDLKIYVNRQNEPMSNIFEKCPVTVVSDNLLLACSSNKSYMERLNEINDAYHEILDKYISETDAK